MGEYKQMKRRKENENHTALVKMYINFLSSLVHFKKSNLSLGEKKNFKNLYLFSLLHQNSLQGSTCSGLETTFWFETVLQGMDYKHLINSNY